MKTLLLLFIALVFAQQPSNPADNGTVEGVVIWASQARPLEGIPVYLRKTAAEPPQEAQRRGVSVTDSAGRFLLKDIPPGEYIVVTDRRGYFRESATELRITVAPKAAVSNVSIRMIVGGSISGRILDSNGLGLAGVYLSTAQPVYTESGKRDLEDMDGGSSDDRGEYRIRGLRPGAYYIHADVNVWASDSTAYYPGVRDPSSAEAVYVREAQDTIASFKVEPRLKSILTISGTVVSSIAGVPAKPVPRILIATRDGDSTYYDNRADDMSNGRFEIRNIFPDVYDLFPEARDKDGALFTSRTTVEVTDQSLENLTLPAYPLVETKGRVTLNGELPAGRLEGLTLNVEVVRGIEPYLIETQGPGIVVNRQGGIAVDREHGEFTTARLAPGLYKLSAGRLPPDVYLEDLRQGPVSVYNDGFAVSDRVGQPIELLLAGPGGKLDGVVRNSRQEPAARATVVLIPDAARRRDHTRYFYAVSDIAGKFAFRAIPPGNYKLFTWESVPQNAWFNAEFMQKYESRGQDVTFLKATSHSLLVNWIPREPEP